MVSVTGQRYAQGSIEGNYEQVNNVSHFCLVAATGKSGSDQKHQHDNEDEEPEGEEK